MMLADGPIDQRLRDAQTLVFVLGGQKCGTTWLQSYFRNHPQVAVPSWKEMNYWNVIEGDTGISRLLAKAEANFFPKGPFGWINHWRNGLAKANPRRAEGIKRALAVHLHPHPPHTEYADALTQFSNEKTTTLGDVSPAYSVLSSDTFAQMAALNPSAKFVFVMRDPAMRFISGVKHGLRSTRDRNGFDQAAFSAEIANQLGKPDGLPMQKTLYHKTMQQLEASVSAQRIAYFFFERLFHQDEIDRLCAFLNIDTHPAKVGVPRNKDTAPEVQPTDEDVCNAVRSLSGVYEDLAGKFGSELPDEWRHSYARGMNHDLV